MKNHFKKGCQTNHALKYFLLVSLVLVLMAGCTKNDTAIICQDESAISLSDNNCLIFKDDGQLAAHREDIQQIIQMGMLDIHRLLPDAEHIEISVIASQQGIIPEIGFSGRAYTDKIRLAFDPTSPVLDHTLFDELFPLLAHEVHHVVRHRTLGFSDNLLEQMVNEGLADHFSIEIAGIDPPIWSVALTDEQLATWKKNAQKQWFDPNYNHSAWFFGTTTDIPRWTGYSVGFDLVDDFLSNHPDRAPSNLIDEPAKYFLP